MLMSVFALQDGLSPELINTQTLLSPMHESAAVAASDLSKPDPPPLLMKEHAGGEASSEHAPHHDPLSGTSLRSRGAAAAPHVDEGSEMLAMSHVARGPDKPSDPCADL